MKLIVLVTSVLFSLATNSLCQDCFRPNNTHGFPNFEDYVNFDLDSAIIPLHHQAIVLSYRFNCCGSIAQWKVALHSAGINDLDLQVWRPQAVETLTGCYVMVGSNTFANISDTVAVLTPPSQSVIHFQPGDVIGFRARSPDGNGVVVLFDRSVRGDRGYETEEIWHADRSEAIIFPMSTCPLCICTENSRRSNELVKAAPVISVSYSMSSCLSTAVLTRPPQTTSTTDGQVVHPTGPDGATTHLATDFVPTSSGGRSAGLSLIIIGTILTVMSVVIIIALTVLMLICIIRRRKNRTITGSHDGDGDDVHSSTDTGLQNITSNTAYGVSLHSGTAHASGGPLAGEDFEDADGEMIRELNVVEAYAMNIVTVENKAYEPLASVGGTSGEYEYIL